MPTTPLKFHGGKHYLATRIIQLMPPHLHYVEPYFGGGSVLLRKNPTDISEVVNDIYLELTNFWRVLQHDALFEKFKRRMEATPFSEIEWRQSANSIPTEYLDFDAAVNFFIRCRQSHAGRLDTPTKLACFAATTKKRLRRGMNEQCSAWLGCIEGLQEVHNRLQRVLIRNTDALDVISENDSQNTLFYLDPTYLSETRTAPDVYQHEMTTQQHIDLLDLIVTLKGKVMISGYPSDLYTQKLPEWNIHDFEIPNNAAGGETKRIMIERVWMNY